MALAFVQFVGKAYLSFQWLFVFWLWAFCGILVGTFSWLSSYVLQVVVLLLISEWESQPLCLASLLLFHISVINSQYLNVFDSYMQDMIESSQFATEQLKDYLSAILSDPSPSNVPPIPQQLQEQVCWLLCRPCTVVTVRFSAMVIVIKITFVFTSMFITSL